MEETDHEVVEETEVGLFAHGQLTQNKNEKT